MDQINSKSKRGGYRKNAGRPKGTGKYGVPTEPINIPLPLKSNVLSYLDAYEKRHKANSQAIASPETKKGLETGIFEPAINPTVLELPLYVGKVSAGRTTGFASPAQDYEQERLDLNEKLIRNPPATFYYEVGKSDDSMIDDGIMPGGLLIVDRSKEKKSGKNVVAIVDGEYVVKRFYKRNDAMELRSRNEKKNYPPIKFKEGVELIIEGVVTWVCNEQ